MKMDVNLLKERWGRKSLTIALGKGRGFEDILQSLIIDQQDDFVAFEKGYIPTYADKCNNIHLVKVRNKDLPWLLSKGYVDVALGSSVWFDESPQPALKQIQEMPFMKCRLSVIAAKAIKINAITRICSKFPNLTNQFLRENNLNAKLMVMEGCHEVALSLGMSDAIIDIIETGKTIERMNFIELQSIKTITHGLWARKMDATLIEEVITQKKELRIS